MLPWIESLNRLNPFTGYLFDKAVTTFGAIIENGAREMTEAGSGSGKRWKPRWRLEEMLEEGFRFPRENEMSSFRKMEGFEEVS